MSTLLALPGRGRRLWLGLALGAGTLALFTVWLAPDETSGAGPVSLASAVLLYLVPVVIVAVFCGVWLGLAAAITADAALNWFFVPPYHTFRIDSQDNFAALTVYILVGVTVSVAVDVAARQRAAALRSGLEAQRQAAHAAQLVEVDRLRTAILAAVGHDLRTPLAGIKAAASSLRDPDVAFSPGDAGELLATIEESADRLDDLVENLLAMSRLQAGVLSAQVRPVALDEVVSRAVLQVPPDVPVRVDVGDDLPRVGADAGLLERVIVNLISNAVSATLRAGSTVPVRLDAAVEATGGGRDRVRLRVIDHGTGVPAPDRERMFAPFQRLDDRSASGGMGLGLAIARGFTEAMGGTLVPADTPGGGLTMTVTLPTAAVVDADRP